MYCTLYTVQINVRLQVQVQVKVQVKVPIQVHCTTGTGTQKYLEKGSDSRSTPRSGLETSARLGRGRHRLPRSLNAWRGGGGIVAGNVAGCMARITARARARSTWLAEKALGLKAPESVLLWREEESGRKSNEEEVSGECLPLPLLSPSSTLSWASTSSWWGTVREHFRELAAQQRSHVWV